MDRGVHWLAGPLSYKKATTGDEPKTRVTTCKWEFIGLTPSGLIRRYQLSYSVTTRKFSTVGLAVSLWDIDHTKDLADLYRPIAILRSMLPKGSLAVAMRAMVKPADIAEVTALSIRGGK